MKDSRVVFLDRDGVINANRDEYVLDVSEFEFLPNAIEALRLLKVHGYDIHVISNQSCVARGLLSMEKLDEITEHMLNEIRERGADIDSVNYCPHHPDENCRCRKPNTGMLEDIARGNGYSFENIWFIGDRSTDMQAANRVGCRTVLVNDEDYTKALRPEDDEVPDYTAKDLYDAVVRIVLADGKQGRERCHSQVNT
jgi:D-glycero-D-manno-heptose 1,7-bisphosphate phosphatase